MRRILIDHARRCRARKRGGNLPDITLSDPIQAPGRCDISLVELLTLNQAMEKLAELDSREAQVVELRFFGGSSMDEIAEILGVSKRTVEGDWMHARAWLRCELSRGEDE
jgi:RNA polymerase sigma factor (TIGR02999 family)